MSVPLRKPSVNRPSRSPENVLLTISSSRENSKGPNADLLGESSLSETKNRSLSESIQSKPAESSLTLSTEGTKNSSTTAIATMINKNSTRRSVTTSSNNHSSGPEAVAAWRECTPPPRNGMENQSGGPQRPPIDRLSSSGKARATNNSSSNNNVIPRNPKDTMSLKKRRSSKGTSSGRERYPQDSSVASVGNQSAGNRSFGNRSAGNQSARSTPLPPASSSSQQLRTIDNDNLRWKNTDEQEQALFEQRLCEDALGVAVRKINQNGKSNLRYVKCIQIADNETGSFADTRSAKSVSSFVRSLSSRRSNNNGKEVSNGETNGESSLQNILNDSSMLSKKKRALTWGKKKDAVVRLDKFVCVRKGKTTYRTKRNICPSTRLLSLITKDSYHSSLDIEAPTKLDRDKFAKAFARFLDVPLKSDETEDNEVASTPAPADVKQTLTIVETINGNAERMHISAGHSATGVGSPMNRNTEGRAFEKSTPRTKNVVLSAASESLGERLHMQVEDSRAISDEDAKRNKIGATQSAAAVTFSKTSSVSKEKLESNIATSATVSINVGSSSAPTNQTLPEDTQENDKHTHQTNDAEEGTVVSSLTGAGFDQEIVEEMHHALTELRAELEASRAEAARAVKVAEQAIQSAEKCNGADWNNTVTHKAAEAAAQAQRRSAEAIAKQRLAEERLVGERRSAAFWKRQAEIAEEEAGVLQTRAAAAEVQRASMAEELESERRKTALHVSSLKQRYASAEIHQREALDAAMERNRALEIELGGARRDLVSKQDEAKVLQDALSDLNTTMEVNRHGSSVRKKLNLYGRKKKGNNDPKKSRDATSLLGNACSSSSKQLPSSSLDIKESGSMDVVDVGNVLRLHAEASAVRQQFELLRRATADELRRLPQTAMNWASQASEALTASQSEIIRLRDKLASESSTRRKLAHQVQDLRGTIRVYCRPNIYNGPKSSNSSTTNGVLSFPSQETLLLHGEQSRSSKNAVESNLNTQTISFEFDRVFPPGIEQNDVYTEVEELVLSMMDGYNVCITTLGQTGSGKTHTILGNAKVFPPSSKNSQDSNVKLENYGIHLNAARQLFDIAEYRNAKYEDDFSITILEVHSERLCDLAVGTEIGNERGQLVSDDIKCGGQKKGRKNKGQTNTDDDCSSKPIKLEIRTNPDGETVVNGLRSVSVSSFKDVLRVWEQCLKNRADRLTEQGINREQHDATSHIIATLKVVSTNMATGIRTTGKIQFVDLAGTDLVQCKAESSSTTRTATPDALMAPIGNSNEWKFANKSLTTLSEVVNARCQFSRNVPYRNSTITHLLSDSLEADTKFLLLVCVSSDPKYLQETACALRLASRMRRIQVGKATKKFLTSESVL